MSWEAPRGWRKTREQVFRMYGRACWRCGRPAGTVGHVRAQVLGGSDGIENLRPECSRCNYSAGAALGNRLYPRVPPWRRRAGAQGVQPMRSSRDW
jgi:5-methylcytosine-specific restriction endonuclease McrA